MRARLIRRTVVVVFIGGIAGMIVGSIADNNGMAVTFGILSAVAALSLILVTSVAPPQAFVADRKGADVDPAVAADVESRIQELVAAGADEDAVRQLVRRSMDLTG